MNTLTREEILASVRLEDEVTKRGIELKKAGKELAGKCPFHEDRRPSFRVNVEKQAWCCDPCGVGGSVVDFIARIEGVKESEVYKRLAIAIGGGSETQQPQRTTGSGKIVKTYDYRDANGGLVYQVCRMDPKDFRQRVPDGKDWRWSMEGVERVIYNLPAVLKASYAWVVEGEKDADSLSDLNLCGTCNVGGAGKWLDSYSPAFKDKEVIVCGDNDTAGRNHVKAVVKSLEAHAKTIRILTVPAPHKDVSDYLASFSDRVEGATKLIEMAEAVVPWVKGGDLPIRSMAELEREYREFVQRAYTRSLDLGAWLPSLGREVRNLVPGEVMTILADTGVGKTMLLQNIAIHCRLVTLLFEMELPGTLTFERFAAMAARVSAKHVESMYRTGSGTVDWRGTSQTERVHVCPLSRMSISEIEDVINRAELKIGERPELVLLDYVGLVRSAGNSRYERLSSIAEDVKVMAKQTNTIIVIASQITRDKERLVPSIHDAKDSGSIENSSGLVLGAWRPSQSVMGLKILKNTKGSAGREFEAQIDLETLLIREQATEITQDHNLPPSES